MTILIAEILFITLLPLHGIAQKKAAAIPASTRDTGKEKDGQHDFDFETGTWKTQLKRLRYHLTDSSYWVEYEGKTVVKKVWDGKANLVELSVDGLEGHIEALSPVVKAGRFESFSENFLTWVIFINYQY